MKEREEVNGTEHKSSGETESNKLNELEETKVEEGKVEEGKVEEVSVPEEDSKPALEDNKPTPEEDIKPAPEEDNKPTPEEESKPVAETKGNEPASDMVETEKGPEPTVKNDTNDSDTKQKASKDVIAETEETKEESAEGKEKDQHEGENDHDEDELANEDFEKYSKEQLVDLVKKLAKHDSPLYADKYLKRVELLFEEIKNAEIEEAKTKFIEEGGEEDGFSFKPDELINRFEANSRLIHDRKSAFVREREGQKQTNLKKAEETLEKLREFVDSEESSASFTAFKEIQSEWRAIGDVPGQYSKTLWANYNALVSRFYDQRSIYFELKELDRKKNYEAKLELCERAEKLADFDNLKEAIGALNELHDEFKHIGPVPEDVQEDLWNRFKTASDAVYHRRKEFINELKSELNENLVKKQELIEKVNELGEFDSDRIKAWNAKTKELLEIQKAWESIGGLPRDKSKEVNRAFWSTFKTFFHNKGKFFKKLDEERGGNYDEKLKLVEKAESLKDNTDWLKTANEYKALQKQWKEIGPVPEKYRNEVYQKFKAACDLFFDNKRASHKEEDKNYKQNLNLKKEIIDQIKQLAEDADNHLEDIKDKSVEFAKVGFVPRKDIKTVKDDFAAAIDAFMNALTLPEDEKRALRMEVELGDILASKNSDKMLYHKEQSIRKQIHQIENDVALWRNNLEFFAQSKTADHLREEVNQKIVKAESRIASLKGQLKVLRSV